MSTSQCRDCGKRVSADALACPRCGAPAPGKTAGEIGSLRRLSAVARSRGIGAAAFFAGLAWLFLSGMTGGAAAFGAAVPGALWLIVPGAAWYCIAELERNVEERRARREAKGAD